jgi:Protein of unknown function (DUF2914)
VNLYSISSSRWYLFLRHHWLTVAFLGGFVTDFLLLNRIDDKFDNAVLFFYVVLASASLVLFYLGVAERGPGWLVRLLTRFTPITMQYAFGGLLSGMLIFYGRSGDLIASAPFLALIIGVIIANEVVKKRSERLLYNISIYFIGVFSYCVLIVPVILGQTSNWIFYGSGLLAVAITMFVIKLLKWVIPNFLIMQKRLLVFSVGCLYVLFNIFYIFNFIPPIPLSLTELSIFQSVERNQSTGTYTIIKATPTWYQKLPGWPLTFSPVPGGGVACFARVYAPTAFKTNVVQRWEYEDKNGDWQERYKQSYPISGENKNGYRGFTALSSVVSGVWRCSVENEHGQVLGRQVFTVDTSLVPNNLVTVTE